MKKNGFTLSELIITLTIIGVASALMAPSITKLMPDKNKVKVNNLHAKIVAATAALIDDDSIYWCRDNEKEEGLSCEGQALKNFSNNNIYSGETKYENLMVYQLGLEPASSPDGGFNWESPDGVAWRFERGWTINNNTFRKTEPIMANTRAYRITVDLDGLAKGPNRIFGQSNEQKPDRFRFRVGNYGSVIPDDAMTAAYLRNSFKSADKRNDRQVANDFLDRSSLRHYKDFN